MNNINIPKVLTLAGSDASGGAGLEADIKTFQEFGVFGMTAITVIVAQNPKDWSHPVFPVALDVIEKQMETILEGVGVDAMKTGMLGTEEIIDLGADYVKRYGIKDFVVDPVMVCKGADDVMNPGTVKHLAKKLLPLAKVTTPNLYEAGFLSGMGAIHTLEELKEAAKRIFDLGTPYVLAKGGAKLDYSSAVDVLYDGKNFTLLEAERVDTNWTHGAGCTSSAAITAGLAHGKSVEEAVADAKKFVTAAIQGSFKLNQFIGPLDHAAWRRESLNGLVSRGNL